jgi:hypothetical protein
MKLKQMGRVARLIATYIPLASLGIILFTNVFNYHYDDTYYKIYPILNEIVGFSLFNVFVYMVVAYVHNFCRVSWMAIFGLLYQNIMNIILEVFDLYDSKIYQNIETIGLTIFVLLALNELRKKL